MVSGDLMNEIRYYSEEEYFCSDCGGSIGYYSLRDLDSMDEFETVQCKQCGTNYTVEELWSDENL